MAKIVLVCLRNPTPHESARMQRRLRRFLTELCPDNLTPASPVLSSDRRGLFLGVFNPADPAATREVMKWRLAARVAEGGRAPQKGWSACRLGLALPS